jgi:hypothetical protein
MVQRKIISSFMLMVLFSFTSVEAQITIVGQDNPTIDNQAVQKAVDEGGTINLKGIFDFGDKGRVKITKDVKIVGEIDPKGSPLTRIKGGFWTFHSPLPAKWPPEASGPKITIQSIHFDGARWVPINLAYSSGATISNNKITNVRPFLIPQPIPGIGSMSMQHGVYCGPQISQMMLPPEKRAYTPDVFTGNLNISDNEIEVTNDNPIKTMAQGIFVIRTTGIKAQIYGNTVFNSSRTSIETKDNYLGKDGCGMVIIRDNKIVTSIEGIPFPTPATPIGILVGWFDDISGGLDPQRNIKYVVLNNGIRTRGKTSVGIGALTDGVVIVNNAIISEGAEAFGLGVYSSAGYIAYNRIEGTSTRPAMLIRPLKPLKGSKNVFVGNDLKKFKSSTAEVVFEKDACHNSFIGHTCKMSDLGSNNSIYMAK